MINFLVNLYFYKLKSLLSWCNVDILVQRIESFSRVTVNIVIPKLFSIQWFLMSKRLVK